MSEVLIALGVFSILIGTTLLIRWLMNLPVSSDPWDDEIDKQDLQNSSSSVCLNCIKPVENSNQHYCPNCGNVTGLFTRYIPFVNIQFNYSIFGSLWKKLINNKTALIFRIIYLFLIIIFAPIMIIVGIPVWVYYMIKNKKLFL
jgi:hypothetical protein